MVTFQILFKTSHCIKFISLGDSMSKSPSWYEWLMHVFSTNAKRLFCLKHG